MLHYVIYTHTTGTSTHVMPLLLTPPAKRWGIGVGSFCTRHMYLSMRREVLCLKSWRPPPPTPMIRAVIIKYAPMSIRAYSIINWMPCGPCRRGRVIRHEGHSRVWHWDDPTNYFAHAQAVLTEGTWTNMLGLENGGKYLNNLFCLLLTNIMTAISYDILSWHGYVICQS